MLTLKQFNRNIYGVFKIMIKTGMPFEVAYRGVVYEIHVKPTNKKTQLTRAKRVSRESVVQAIVTTECPECKSLVFNDICMNTKCVLSTSLVSSSPPPTPIQTD